MSKYRYRFFLAFFPLWNWSASTLTHSISTLQCNVLVKLTRLPCIKQNRPRVLACRYDGWVAKLIVCFMENTVRLEPFQKVRTYVYGYWYFTTTTMQIQDILSFSAKEMNMRHRNRSLVKFSQVHSNNLSLSNEEEMAFSPFFPRSLPAVSKHTFFDGLDP